MNELRISPTGPLADTLREVLNELGKIIGEINVANGWDTSRDMLRNPGRYTEKHKVTHKIAELGLIATEVAEAIEEVRAGKAMDHSYYPRRDHLFSLPVVERTQYPEWPNGPFKPEGVPSELADVIIRVLDLADAYGIDIGAAVVEKLNHNATRGLHHGGKAL